LPVDLGISDVIHDFTGVSFSLRFQGLETPLLDSNLRGFG